MNSVESLLVKLCPNGVKIESLGSLVEILDNLRKPISKDKRTEGEYPYYGANGIQGFVDNYIFDGTYLLLGEDGSVMNTDNSPILNWVTGKIWVNNHAHVLEELPAKASLRYIYYYLQTKDISDLVRGVPPKLNQELLRGIKIFVPPIEVQNEIVRILDTFSKLEVELEAELQARGKQYAFYREALFASPTENLELKTIDEVATIWRGRRFVKDDILSEGVPAIHYGEIYTKYGLSATRAYSYLDAALASKLRFAKTGDVVLVSAGETIEDIGKSFVWLGEEDVVIHDACYGLRSKIVDPRYMVHFFNTHNFRSQLQKYISTSKISAISPEKLGKVFIPVPPLARQLEIADSLDAFDALISDDVFGLPAEIISRRKQFQHYRNKLLTFKELESE